MAKIIKLGDAIESLNPSAVVLINHEDITWLEGTTPISLEDIKAEQKRLQDIEDSK
jgi:hypothetical protein|tara:strand:- start:49 stop:216 length:168 start_codon:yes stop_codon:yes gene_type:complete